MWFSTGFGHFKSHAKTLQAGGDGSAQIMDAQWSQRRGRGAAFGRGRASVMALSSVVLDLDHPENTVPTAPGSTNALLARRSRMMCSAFASFGSVARIRSRTNRFRSIAGPPLRKVDSLPIVNEHPQREPVPHAALHGSGKRREFVRSADPVLTQAHLSSKTSAIFF
jgi:hypothetical protein